MNRLALVLMVALTLVAMSAAQTQTQTTGFNPQSLLWYAMMRGDWGKFMRYYLWSQALGGGSGGSSSAFNPFTLMLLRGLN